MVLSEGYYGLNTMELGKLQVFFFMSFISEKKLFYVGKDRKQNRLVVVSEEEKKKVLRECHENGTGVHHGISRTLTLVESSYYWTSVTNDVKQWVWLVGLEIFLLSF